MTTSIDTATLRAILAHTESMVEYYGKSDEKRRQNEALVAAGLEPIHSEGLFAYDAKLRAERLREAECLRRVIAYHEGRIYTPSEAEAA